METKKLVLLIIFSSSLLFLWDAWQKELNPPTASKVMTGTTDASNQRHDPLPVPGDGLAASTDGKDHGIAAGIEGVNSSVTPNLFATGEKVTIKTDMIVAEIDTAGGDIRQLGLLKHPSREDKDKPYELLLDKAARFQVAQSGLIGDNLPNHKTKFTVASNQYNYELESGRDTL